MAVCKIIARGNVVSWDFNKGAIDDDIRVYNVVFTELLHAKELCKVSHHLVIFPERVLYPKAKETCRIHGGSLAVPHSEREGNQMLEIVEKHKILVYGARVRHLRI